jgi:Ser/Thr protein kinase RdoA (MazF antagonist)
MLQQEPEGNQEDLFDLNEVMHTFGVDEWSNLGPIASPPAVQLNLQVEIQGQCYLLRERRETPAEDDSNHRYEFRNYLQQAGIPTPPLWLTPEGTPFVTIGEDAFELEQWVDGRLFSTADPRSLAWVAAAGTMLGRLHQASRRYRGPQHRWPSEVHAGALVQGWLNFARSKAEESEIYAISSALSNLVEQWEAALPAAMMAIGSVRGLPEFHIHGDYHPLNLRFDNQGVCAVLGLDASRWEKRIIELAYSLFYFSALEWRPDSKLTRPLVKRGFESERVRRFLHAYSAVYPPVPNETLVLVDALTLVTPIVSVNGPLEDVFFAEEGMEEPLIEDVLERLAWAASLPGWLEQVRHSFAEMWG